METIAKPLRVLIVEDSDFDAQLLLNLLRKGHWQLVHERVETESEFKKALQARPWDMILADYNLPQFSAPRALEILQASEIDIPFVIVSGGIGEDTAVAAMKAGAHDYLMKGNLVRLVAVVERELREAANREGRRQATKALKESELRYRLLWETATDAVILINTQSLIEFANPAVEEVFGYKPGEIIGRPLSVLQPENLRSLHMAGLERYLQTGVKKLNWRATETVGLCKDGREIPIEIAFSDMEVEEKRWFVGFIRDITDRKKAELELRHNQEQFQVAHDIQQHLFPKEPPSLPGFEIAGLSYPAEATGGDYFDYLPMLNDCAGVVIGDVTGHGVGPALLMAETRAYLRILAKNREDTGEILTQANRVLAEDLGPERFITLLLAKINTRTRVLRYTSAGHSPGYILDPAGAVKHVLRRTGIPLGIRPETDYFTSGEIRLFPGDLILLLTDGFEEAISPNNIPYGSERALSAVARHRDQPAQKIVQKLCKDLFNFTEGTQQLDDITVVVLKVAGDPAAPAAGASIGESSLPQTD